ncbi:uncharacterized protein LOC117117407 isoform X5 [Anneissia japonica]|uniref:uncharacterized protein LOC117117407 isoform X5 n=1 Tax=Anneissia japonica TaxID=1529436 RepID=UPI0014258AB0|nr:uncharacterized protein LOC117117407 isoform X5 [Anneissia japonica]
MALLKKINMRGGIIGTAQTIFDRIKSPEPLTAGSPIPPVNNTVTDIKEMLPTLHYLPTTSYHEKGTAQTIFDRIKSPEALTAAGSPIPPVNNTVTDIKEMLPTLHYLPTASYHEKDTVAISTRATLLVVLILFILSVLFWKRQQIFGYKQVQRIQDIEMTSESKEIALNGHQEQKSSV